MARRSPEQVATRSEDDGRVQRSVRSRERILDALTELVSEGVLQPTAQQVAARASVSLRTVFRHFDDMEGLYREMQGRLNQVLRPLIDRAVPEGSLEVRVHDLVQRRSALFEKGAPFLRADVMVRWRSLFLSQAHDQMVRGLRLDLLRTLPEVADLPAERRDALELVTSFEAYDRLRTDQRLGRDRAQAVMTETVQALLS